MKTFIFALCLMGWAGLVSASDAGPALLESHASLDSKINLQRGARTFQRRQRLIKPPLVQQRLPQRQLQLRRIATRDQRIENRPRFGGLLLPHQCRRGTG